MQLIQNLIFLISRRSVSKRTPARCPLLLITLIILWSGLPLFAFAQKNQKEYRPLVVSQGKLSYHPDPSGNRIPDFSYSGYAASERDIPNLPIKITVPLTDGDATDRIQTALNYVASLPPDQNGFRGAVLLQKGKYLVYGQLKINASGVVLRGSGAGKNGTVIVGAGTDRETLIRISGRNDKATGDAYPITDSYVPVNATIIHVSQVKDLKAGDDVIIHRPSTAKWINDIGTDHFGGGLTTLGWKPGERDLFFERKILSIDKNSITLDVPLTTALDSSYGVSDISVLKWPGRIENCGVENLSLESAYDRNNPKDEAHRWMAITLENISDAWVRQVNFKHFAGSAVAALETSKRITVEDCRSLHPVSEIGGQRRYSFFTSGQQVLFQRCYAENGYHDFAVGFCAPGPNAFVQCHSSRPYSFSGTIDSWASGVLFDIVNVDGQALRFANRGQDGQGAGWSAANSVFWQCTAARIDCEKPPTANNYSFGSWAQFSGNGYWESSNEQIQPRSLFYAQLSERKARDITKRAFLLPVETEASSSPSADVAKFLTGKALVPVITLDNWIDSVSKMNPIPTFANGIKTVDASGVIKQDLKKQTSAMHIKNGWLVKENILLTGRRQDVPWWSGGILPKDLLNAKSHITRFVPGRTGKGLTDDLDSLTGLMQRSNVTVMEHNYGLWYDRRRDDHERIRRMDGEVWAPFYELPFSRSGKDTAWDGLSKYDLTKYNVWYWNRLRKFADLADQKSLVLFHQNYFQHNIIEAGAHYTDFPWRTANNINATGFPEPVPYAGDKRIFMAEQFYDVTHAARKKIHTNYIRQCLDNFKNNTSVLQLIGAEYTGPLHFVQFWLDVIQQWEKEKGVKQLIALSTTKDVQDAILSDKLRSSTIDVIDIRYWHYQEDGTEYAPKGGQNLAPRQHARLLKPRRTSFDQVYRAVSEYKQKFPQKAVIYSGDNHDKFGWAVFMAGGSLAELPLLDTAFLSKASNMKPVYDKKTKGQWMMKNENEYVIYSEGSNTVQLPLAPGKYISSFIDPQSGMLTQDKTIINGGKMVELKNTGAGDVVIWIKKAE